MKKSIVMAFVALAMTVSVQAASFNWGVSLVYYTGQTAENVGAVGLTGNLWLVYLSTGSTSGISVDNAGALTLDAGQSLATSVVNFTGDGTFGYAGATTTTFGNKYVVVGYDSVGNKYGISDIYTTSEELAIPGGGTAKDGVFSNVNPDPFGMESPALNLGIAAVPEPTSMALLALGAAALGLRRKLRK
jgi:hypothetical protein